MFVNVKSKASSESPSSSVNDQRGVSEGIVFYIGLPL